MVDLLGVAVLFLIIAFVAYILGVRGVAGFTMEIAKILLVVFVVLFLVTLIFVISRLGKEVMALPKGKDDRFTEKEDRQAMHVMESEEERGKSPEEAERIGYATVNKLKSKKTG